MSFSYTSSLNNKFHLMRVEVKDTLDWDQARPEWLCFQNELSAAMATGLAAPDLGTGVWRSLRQLPNDWPRFHGPWPGELGFPGKIWWTDPDDLEQLALDPDYFHTAYGWPPRP